MLVVPKMAERLESCPHYLRSTTWYDDIQHLNVLTQTGNSSPKFSICHSSIATACALRPALNPCDHAMTSIKELEDTLPLHDSHQDRSGVVSSKQYPIYSLVAFDDRQLRQLESHINKAEDSTNQSVLINQPNSSSSTLRDIYEHHIQLRTENKDIHPSLFIVADQRDYQAKGVLVVDLQVMTDSPPNVIGVLRCGYADADLYCANLDIGNMSFIDYKEEEQSLWGGDNLYENKRYFPEGSAPSTSPLGDA